jgi:AhpD family alkylhydroperoxidase
VVFVEHIDHIRDELRQPALDLRSMIPDVLKGFAEMSRGAMAEGELSTGFKELIALSIAATRECDGCVAAHARGVVRAGITRQQVAEAMGVVIMMNGGPGTVWGPRALNAYDEAQAAQKS